MATNKKRQAQSLTTNFVAILETTLKHFQDPKWLGENSAFASPYYLGDHLTEKAGNSIVRGHALQKLLRRATSEIRGKNCQRYQTILVERYFRKRPVEVVSQEVGLAKNAFHINRRKAIAALERTLVGLTHPSLRLEYPPVSRDLIEREEVLARVLVYLDANQDVTILGPDGGGKTALAAQLAQETGRPTFWYTIRPGLNDSIESFVFELGLFAHMHGESSLWFELVATQGKINIQALPGLISFALQRLKPAPLICIDDADALHPADNQAHGVLIQLLETLRSIASLVVVGQRLIMDTEQYIPLRGLSPQGAASLFAQNQIAVSSEDVRLYHAWTQGNPRLLNLCCSILSAIPNGGEGLYASSSTPTLDLLLDRIVVNFSGEERALLAKLSVFRRPAPFELLHDQSEKGSFNLLKSKQVVEASAGGDVELMPVYRQFVYNRLPVEVRRLLHQEAANVRSAYGEYASTLYHLIQADQFGDAVDLWQMTARQELEQGQASNVLAVFRQALQEESMGPEIRDVLRYFCSELERFLGNFEQARQDMNSISQPDPLFPVDVLELKGKIENDRSEYARAKQSFEMALEKANVLLDARLAQIHKGMAWMHLRQHEFDQVETELTIAQFEIENMRGNLAFDQCRYDYAASHYTKALTLAREVDSRDAIAKTSHNLAAVHMIRGEFEACFESLDQAYQHYELMNRVAAMAGCRITTAVAYNLAEDNKHALDSLEEAEQHLSTMGGATSWQQALIEQAKAEAFLGLGEWVDASVHATRAISAGDLGVLPDAHRTYGEVLMNQGQWGKAEVHLLKSISLASQNEDILLLAYGQRALGKLYLVQGRGSIAQQTLAEALSLFQSIQLPTEVKSCEQLLSESQKMAIVTDKI